METISTKEFLEERKCDYFGCNYNYGGECVFDYSQEFIKSIRYSDTFVCYNFLCFDNICPKCGVEFKKVVKHHREFNFRDKEISWECPICHGYE